MRDRHPSKSPPPMLRYWLEQWRHTTRRDRSFLRAMAKAGAIECPSFPTPIGNPGCGVREWRPIPLDCASHMHLPTPALGYGSRWSDDGVRWGPAAHGTRNACSKVLALVISYHQLISLVPKFRQDFVAVFLEIFGGAVPFSVNSRIAYLHCEVFGVLVLREPLGQ